MCWRCIAARKERFVGRLRPSRPATDDIAWPSYSDDGRSGTLGKRCGRLSLSDTKTPVHAFPSKHLPREITLQCDAVNVGVRRRFRADLTQFLHSSRRHLFVYVVVFFGMRPCRACRSPPEMELLVIARARSERFGRNCPVSCSSASGYFGMRTFADAVITLTRSAGMSIIGAMLGRLVLACALFVTVTSAALQLVPVATGHGAPLPVAAGHHPSSAHHSPDGAPRWNAPQATNAPNAVSVWKCSDVHAALANLSGRRMDGPRYAPPSLRGDPSAPSPIHGRTVPLLI
jgi:hypothetical protein